MHSTGADSEGPSVTLLAARIIPRDQTLRPALYGSPGSHSIRMQSVNTYLAALLQSPKHAITRFTDDIYVYDNLCFAVPPENTLSFRTAVKQA